MKAATSRVAAFDSQLDWLPYGYQSVIGFGQIVQDHAQVAELAAAVQALTGEVVALADVDQADSGNAFREAAAAQVIDRAALKLPAVRRGFVLLPCR